MRCLLQQGGCYRQRVQAQASGVARTRRGSKQILLQLILWLQLILLLNSSSVATQKRLSEPAGQVTQQPKSWQQGWETLLACITCK